MRNLPKTKRGFIIIKKGPVYRTLKTEEIIFIYTKNKVTYVVENGGKKTFCSENLNDLEKKLDTNFFRASRQHLINAEFIKSFRSNGVKVLVELGTDDFKTAIQISQVSASKFKNWIYGL